MAVSYKRNWTRSTKRVRTAGKAAGVILTVLTEVLSVLEKIVSLVSRQPGSDVPKLSRWLRCLFSLSLPFDDDFSLKCIDQVTLIAAKQSVSLQSPAAITVLSQGHPDTLSSYLTNTVYHQCFQIRRRTGCRRKRYAPRLTRLRRKPNAIPRRSWSGWRRRRLIAQSTTTCRRTTKRPRNGLEKHLTLHSGLRTREQRETSSCQGFRR